MAAIHPDTTRSDALVLFGATGDLACKMIFPALYAMARHGRLTMPVIGVAFSHWSLAQLKQRAEDGVRNAGPVEDQQALQHLLASLRYVDGDYNDAATFTALGRALEGALHPTHYLA